MSKPTCPYCGREAEWVENKEIYGKNYGDSYMIWLCRDCDAYVGCHENTKEPLGTLANEETRKWREKAHKEIDKHWKDDFYTRGEVYTAISNELGKDMHIAEADVDECREIIRIANEIFGKDKPYNG